jgi:putative transposase
VSCEPSSADLRRCRELKGVTAPGRHRQSKYLNNRAENSHQSTRQREQAMKGFRSPGRAQRFLACFSLISPHFRPRRHLLSATEYRTEMRHRFRV